ncbi:response regulator [Longimicrobium sp.]|uniref:response regulator n=1 Tax=Longimicrobium sp. TaxID=2029185 RepID=UPI0032C21096
MADDDEDDRLLAREALAQSLALAAELRFVNDGVELMQYLRREPPFADAAATPRPGVILLDLNMPRMDGREALQALKADPELRRIPVVVMSTSQADEDIVRSYDLGAASFITKPVTFEGLVEVMRGFGTYWTEVVGLPADE